MLVSINLIGQKTIYYDSLYTIDSSTYTFINHPLTIDFNNAANREYVFIDSTQPNNVWVFDSIKKPNFIVSDSIFLTTGKTGNYDTSLFSSFILKLKIGNSGNYKWFSSFGLGFIHKYDTDSAVDGLLVENSTDGGLTWSEAVWQFNSSSIYWNALFNRYDSTINWPLNTFIPNTNKLINSGKSDSLIYSRLAWGMMGVKTGYDSILIRVTFHSDNINNQKPGWAIKKIIVEGNFFETGGFEESSLSKDYKIFADEKSVIIHPFGSAKQNAKASIYNVLGQKIMHSKPIDFCVNKFSLNNCNSGVYIVEISSNIAKLTKKIILE